jgi:hypothetical protein
LHLGHLLLPPPHTYTCTYTQVAYATATEEMVQIRKSFTTVGLMARVLSGKRCAPIPALQTWVRHAYVKAVTSQVLGMAKGLKGPCTKDW